MMLTKVKIAGMLLITAMAFGGGAGWFTFRAPAVELAARETPAGKDEKPHDDKDAIQGTWKVIAVERDGNEAPDDNLTKFMKSATWTVESDKVIINWPQHAKHESSYKLDPTKKPKQIDFTPLDGPPNVKVQTNRCIYSLEGDVLKMCSTDQPEGDKRPTELKTNKGDKTILVTFKRAMPAKENLKEDKPEADKQAIQGVWQVTDVEAKDKNFPGKVAVLPNVKTQQWIFTADKITVRMPGEKDIPAAVYTLDPSKSPKKIDAHAQNGVGELGAGLYSLEGDVLKLCFPGPQGGPRPTELAADDAGKNVLLTLKRVTTDKEKPKEDKPKDDAKVKKLLEDLCNAANEEFRMRKQVFREGHSSVETLAGAARRVLTAELERSEKKEDRVRACDAYLQQITEVAKMAKIQLQAGTMAPADAAEAEYHRLEAEIMLEREKAR